ncbi:DUF3558 family protein [Amycolatopsis sp. H20-H5]|uniref:DUF3558 family protein n=1 Tax=Amycolatopsis sp. H20-H5 TaxID=3046309 RepID=UPI002DBCB1D4|nr:DUF3558 family protein [Amycolatopsis sp. H20-H5]MEC3978581.1 DUF3558 family protein [Amycolatopsis sp. H20-H5]
MTTRRRPATLTLAALALTLTACSSAVGGSATPATTPPPTSASPTSPTDPFLNSNPCTILDQALAGEGYPTAVPSSADPKHACSFNKPTYGTVGLLLQAGQTIDEGIPDPSKARTGHVKDRRAIQVRENVGAKGDCMNKIEVKPNSRAIVVVTLVSRDTDEACTYANQASAKIEMFLPKTG